MIPQGGCLHSDGEGGVEKAYIVDSRKPHAILLELLADEGIGAMTSKKIDHETVVSEYHD